MTAIDSELATDLPIEAQPYLAAVAALLAALPSDQRDELLEDLSAHLRELAAEPGVPLAEQLGPPSRYAAEFVSSAGVEVPVAEPSRRRLRDSIALPPSIRTRLAELRPAWWVLRPFVIAAAVGEGVHDGFLSGDGGVFEVLVVAAAATCAISVSTRIGRDRSRWDVALSVAGIIAALVVVGAMSSGHTRTVYIGDGKDFGPSGNLLRGDGMPVTNIWAYDRNGRPVQVFLYDQLGRPIDDVTGEGYDERTGERIVTDLPRDANGAPVGNLYPRPQRRIGGTGESSRSDPPPAVTTPRLGESSTTTTAPPAPSP